MNKILLLLLFSLIGLNSCIIVKYSEEEKRAEQEIKLSPKPILPMTDNIIRSPKGDMISQLPKGWFLVDVEQKISPDVIAVAINQEYNLSAVFSSLKNNASIAATVEKEGLYGLARMCYLRREQKSAGMVKQVGKYQLVSMGNQDYVKYEYISNSTMTAQSAVFISSNNEFYEFSLLPLSIEGRKLPDRKEIDEIFQSILATIRY